MATDNTVANCHGTNNPSPYAPGTAIPEAILDALYSLPPGYEPNWREAFCQAWAENRRLKAEMATLQSRAPAEEFCREMKQKIGNVCVRVTVGQDGEWTIWLGSPLSNYYIGHTFDEATTSARTAAEEYVERRRRREAEAASEAESKALLPAAHATPESPIGEGIDAGAEVVESQ